MESVLITGAGGFVGRNMIRRLDPRKFDQIYCLSRSASRLDLGHPEFQNVKLLRGGPLDIHQYERELVGSETVVHLAAVTAKARPGDYFRTNVDGTRWVLEQCSRLSVSKFLHISSIAVRFPEKSRYYYAQSKEQAEELVRRSGLRYVIVRPTLILGPGAPLWPKLVQLAGLPIISVFGNGKALLQPIHVEDLADFLLAILDRDLFQGETFELGGPEVISIESLLGKIRQLSNRGSAPMVHLPLGLLSAVLSLAEKLFFPLVPLTAGQLYSFRYDGTIAENWLYAERRSSLKTIDETLASLCLHGDC